MDKTKFSGWFLSDWTGYGSSWKSRATVNLKTFDYNETGDEFLLWYLEEVRDANKGKGQEKKSSIDSYAKLVSIRCSRITISYRDVVLPLGP